MARGSFSFLRIELGDFVAYIAAGNILLEAIVGAAGLGRSWTSYFASMISNDPDFLRIRVKSFKEGFNMLDPIAVVVLLIVNGIAMSGTKRTSILNWLSSIATTFVIGFIIVVGFMHAKTSNLVPFFPYGAKGVFEAAAVVYWSYTGFDMVATMAEETKKPSRDIPVGLVGSMTMITVIYCLMALALVMMEKYTQIDGAATYATSKAGLNVLTKVMALEMGPHKIRVNSISPGLFKSKITQDLYKKDWLQSVAFKTVPLRTYGSTDPQQEKAQKKLLT